MFSIKQIFGESLTVLLITSVISLIAGLFLRSIQDKLLVILPLIIILPALNGMIGNYGIIIISRFTTELYKFKKKNVHYHLVKHMFREIIQIAIMSAIYIAILATFIAYIKGFDFDSSLLWKIIWITLATTITLVILIFIVSIISIPYVYKRKMDPDNILIPITTSIADLGSMIIFFLIIRFLF